MTHVQQGQEKEPVTRKGYALRDVARSFVQVLGEASPVASGKLLHYTADLIGSGGFDLWVTLCWDYAFEHIGLASPRIFVYLKKKFVELMKQHADMPFATFVHSPTIQQATFEVVLILQGCPKRLKTKMPPTHSETHQNDGWFEATATSPLREAVRRAWSRDHDQEVLARATNEMMVAVTDGALEKALFWLKWIQEEDGLVRRLHKSGLSTMERGPADSKQRTAVAYFVCAVAAEAYKEFAAKGLVRMHEEVQALLDLYRSGDRHLSAARRQDILILILQILTEVPRWKVPAAPSLVRDPIVLERAVAQAETFYREILAHPMPTKPLPAKVGPLKKKIVPTSQDKLQHQLNSLDDAILSFYKL